MTRPKFPWALLVLLGMFGYIGLSPKTPAYFQLGCLFAILLVGAAAIYQLIPRKDPSIADPDALMEDEWNPGLKGEGDIEAP